MVYFFAFHQFVNDYDWLKKCQYCVVFKKRFSFSLFQRNYCTKQAPQFSSVNEMVQLEDNETHTFILTSATVNIITTLSQRVTNVVSNCIHGMQHMHKRHVKTAVWVQSLSHQYSRHYTNTDNANCCRCLTSRAICRRKKYQNYCTQFNHAQAWAQAFCRMGCQKCNAIQLTVTLNAHTLSM